jgi:hypothetical protein
MAMLHAGSAVEAIAAQPDPAAAFAMATKGPDAASGALLDQIRSRYLRLYPPVEAGEEAPAPAVAPEPAPVAAGAFAEVHAAGEHSWGEGEAGALAAAAAFMDAQLIFSAPERFDTWGNAKRVQRVLYVMGGVLAAVVLLILVVTRPKDEPEDNAVNALDPATPSYLAATPVKPPPLPRGQHHKKECINVSGASYCTTS